MSLPMFGFHQSELKSDLAKFVVHYFHPASACHLLWPLFQRLLTKQVFNSGTVRKNIYQNLEKCSTIFRFKYVHLPPWSPGRHPDLTGLVGREVLWAWISHFQTTCHSGRFAASASSSHSGQTAARQSTHMFLVPSALWTRSLTSISTPSLEGRLSEFNGSIQVSGPNCQSHRRMSTSSRAVTTSAHSCGSTFPSGKATSMHLKLQMVELTGSFRPISPCHVWGPAQTGAPVLHQVPNHGKRYPPSL